MSFIKKIWEGKPDEAVHAQFIRFGKGTFESRAILNAALTTKIKINTTFDLTNDLVLFVAGLVEKLSASGVILAKHDIASKLTGVVQEKKKGPLFSYTFKTELSSEQLSDIAADAYFLLLDCEGPGISLKTKKRIPRPKTQRGGAPPKPDERFCVLLLDKNFWPQFHDEFLFDLPEQLKKVRLDHTYVITEIVLPQGEKDFEKMRLLAKRKGKVIRHAAFDGKELSNEKSFVA